MVWRRVPAMVAALGATLLSLPAHGAMAHGAAAHGAAAQFGVFAGTGESGFTGDGGPATAATLYEPTAVAVGADGTVYIADSGNGVVRAVGSDGVIRTVVGTPGRSGEVTPLGPGESVPATEIVLGAPTALAVGADGALYIADSGGLRILVRGADGQLSTFAGTGERGFSGDGGPAVEARIGAVKALVVATDGTVYLGDLGARRVRAVAPDGTIDTVLGSGADQVVGGGPAHEAGLPYVTSLAVDADGSLWVTSTLLQRLTDGRLGTVCWTRDDRWEVSDTANPLLPERAIQGPVTVAVHDGHRYLLDEDALRLLSADGAIRTAVEVPAHLGPFAVDDAGHAYLVDVLGDRIWRADVSDVGADESDGGSGGGAPLWWTVGTMATLLLAAGGVVLRRRLNG